MYSCSLTRVRLAPLCGLVALSEKVRTKEVRFVCGVFSSKLWFVEISVFVVSVFMILLGTLDRSGFLLLREYLAWKVLK